jgi:hypothetical protein
MKTLLAAIAFLLATSVVQAQGPPQTPRPTHAAPPVSEWLPEWCLSNGVHSKTECDRAMAIEAPSARRNCGDIGPNGECLDECEDENAPGCGQKRPKPKPPAFRPWSLVWQCSDLRITVGEQRRGVTTFDVGGTIFGGAQFTTTQQMAGYVPLPPALFFNGRPCQLLTR